MIPAGQDLGNRHTLPMCVVVGFTFDKDERN